MLLELLGVLTFIYISPLLVPRDHWLRFYVCYFAYAVHGSIIPAVFIPLQFINFQLYSAVVLSLASLGCKILRIEWDIRNKQNYNKYNGGFVISNHQSVFDVTGLIILNNGFRSMGGVAKKELRYILPLALFCWKIGIIFIDRNNPKEAMKIMAEAFSLNKDKKIMIFPEGTRNQKGNGLLPFKRGAFKLAVELKQPIFPVVLSPYTFIKANKEFKGGKVIISCLEPIETINLKEEDVQTLMNTTRKLMEDEYFKLSAEINTDNNNECTTVRSKN